MVGDDGPIDTVPPALSIGSLAADAESADAVVGQVDVFPGIDAEDGDEVDAAGGQLLLGVGAVRTDGVDGVAAQGAAQGVADALVVLGVHVDGLAAVVGSRVRRAREVRRQDRILAAERVLDEPDEARAEHRAGRDDELLAERGDGGEGRLELLLQGLRHDRLGG